MPVLLIAWRFLRPLMPYIAAALVVLGLLSAYGHREYGRGKHSRDAEVAALNGTIANFKAASVAAKAQNVAHVATVETAQDAVTKGHENDYPTQLADARAALAAYKLRHPATSQGDAGHDPVSQVPDAPGKPDADPAQAVVSGADLDACAQSYVIAVGLQSWIRDQAAIPR
jgi:hypothetical protein